MSKLLARGAERELLVVRLQARVAELEEKLAASSRNSSKPPSSDPPAVERKAKTPTGRKRGGQLGHQKHEREFFPPEKVQKVVECKPAHCERCRGRLRGHDEHPLRHQVAELPKIEPEVTEFRLHELACDCGHRTRAKLPDGTPTGAFGATVVAAITLLLGVYGLSRRDTADLLRDMFALPISVGGVVGCQRLGAAALEVPHEQALAEITTAPIKYSDETGWKLCGRYACLWVVVTAKVTVFRIQAERSREAAMKVLGTISGLLGSDRYSVYDCWPTHMHQFCWAHLSRLFLHFSERRDPTVKAVGLALIERKTACSRGGIGSATARSPVRPSSATCCRCNGA